MIRSKHFLYYLLIVFFLISQKAISQTPFSKMEVDLSGIYTGQEKAFGSSWQNGVGGEVNLAFNLKTGAMELGYSRSRFLSKDLLLRPSYSTNTVYAGWKYVLFDGNWIKFGTGIRVGIWLVDFDRLNTFADHRQRLETEIMNKFDGFIQVKIWRNTYFKTTGNISIVYLSDPILLPQISCTIGHTFNTPKWLRTFLN